MVLDITSVSNLGASPGYVEGKVWNAPASSYNVVVYVFAPCAGQWYPKPTYANPDTPIDPQGKWRCLITTGGCDDDATEVFAGLAPKSYKQPDGPLPSLPRSLFDHCVSWMTWTREPGRSFRTLRFPWNNWYAWEVKSGTGVGPGPNDFSASNWSVWVDGDWKLHLAIVNRGGWKCAEVINRSALGYGTYRWTVANRVDDLAPCAVLGLFTWDDGAPPVYGELDIEFSRWCDPGDVSNAQYVVQPWDLPNHRLRWTMPPRAPSTHLIRWSAGKAVFESHEGETPKGTLIRKWIPPGDVSIPVPAQANPRANLWLYEGNAPGTGGKHVILSNFTHTP
jgi:hypothetical protein